LPKAVSRDDEEKTVTIRMKLLMSALLIVLAAGPSYPQNRETLQHYKDMIDLQLMVKQLQTTVDRDSALLKGLLEKMADQTNTITAGIQKLNQAVDSIRTQNDSTTKEVRAALKTLNDTVKELETDVSSARGQINTISREMTSLKNTAEPLASPDDLWRSAYVDFSAGNWALAISAYQEFLSKYPTDPRAVEAQIHIGDALKEQKQYDVAITQYDIVLQKYPESDKTRAALLKKGLAQAETNQPQATSTLNEVLKKFPGTIEAINAQAKLKELQAAKPRTPAR
jgi:tol-pal system protein YbgF